MLVLEEIKEIEIESAYFSVKDNIMRLRLKPDIEITPELAEEGLAMRVKLQRGLPALALVDSREMLNMTSEARAFIADYERKHNLNIALAILSDSLATNIIANFFIRFNKPHAPTKLFKDEESALAWLNTFR